MPGAVVNPVHEPTGIRYSTVTRADGRFGIRSVRLGGPYTVTVTMTGFRTQDKKDLFVKVGETLEPTSKLQLETIKETL